MNQCGPIVYEGKTPLSLAKPCTATSQSRRAEKWVRFPRPALTREPPVIGRKPLAEAMRASVDERLREARATLLSDTGFDVFPVNPEITVDAAIVVLNQRNHRDWDDWKFFGSGKAYVAGAHGSIVYSAFDAVAIAEKYQRDA